MNFLSSSIKVANGKTNKGQYSLIQRYDSTLRRKLNLISPTRLALLLMKLRKYHAFQHEGSAQLHYHLTSYVPHSFVTVLLNRTVCFVSLYEHFWAYMRLFITLLDFDPRENFFNLLTTCSIWRIQTIVREVGSAAETPDKNQWHPSGDIIVSIVSNISL